MNYTANVKMCFVGEKTADDKNKGSILDVTFSAAAAEFSFPRCNRSSKETIQYTARCKQAQDFKWYTNARQNL